MQATILIKLGNSVRSSTELAEILRQLADAVVAHGKRPAVDDSIQLRDRKGEAVGVYLVESTGELL